MIISDRLCLLVLNFCPYWLIGISIKSHIGATLMHSVSTAQCERVCFSGGNFADTVIQNILQILSMHMCHNKIYEKLIFKACRVNSTNFLSLKFQCLLSHYNNTDNELSH